jgi:hypothetical protein
VTVQDREAQTNIGAATWFARSVVVTVLRPRIASREARRAMLDPAPTPVGVAIPLEGSASLEAH